MMPVDPIFLWEVWDDLTDEETPPSCLAPYAAPVLLLHETIYVSRLAINHERWRKPLQQVLKEAHEVWTRLREQVAAASHLVPWLEPRLAFEVVEALPRANSALTDADVYECHHRIRRLVHHVADPVEDLLCQLDSLDPKHKEDATRILGWVVAELGWRGWSPAQIEDLAADASTGNLRDGLSASVRRLFPQRTGTRTCSLGVHTPVARLNPWLRLDGVRVRAPTEPERDSFDFPVDSDDCSVVDWQSLDAGNDALASRRCHELLGRALVMANVLGGPALEAVQISPRVSVTWHGDDSADVPRVVNVEEDYTAWERAPGRLAGALGDYLENELDLRTLDPSMEYALDRYRAAVDEPHMRERFLGMWSTLEGMSAVLGRGEVLSRVEALVVPAVLGGHIRTLLNHALKNHKEIGVDVLTPGRLLQVLANPDTATLKQLAGKCAEAKSPLEVHRLGQLHEQVKNPKAMLRMFANERVCVERQLARMYRARNLLVHSNERYPSLTRLAQEIQHYARLSLASALHRLPPAKTLEGALYDCRDHVRWLDHLLRTSGEVRASDAGVLGNLVIYPGTRAVRPPASDRD